MILNKLGVIICLIVPLSLYLCQVIINVCMKTKNEYIEILKRCATVLRTRFGVRSLCLFGSVAREEQKETSDVDVCVEMKPNLFLRIELKRYLEEQLGCPVDVIRMHNNMNDFLKKQIEKDGIFVLS